MSEFERDCNTSYANLVGAGMLTRSSLITLHDQLCLLAIQYDKPHRPQFILAISHSVSVLMADPTGVDTFMVPS